MSRILRSGIKTRKIQERELISEWKVHHFCLDSLLTLMNVELDVLMALYVIVTVGISAIKQWL